MPFYREMWVRPMLTFCGFDLELFVERVLTRQDGPALCCARDWTGNQWLIVAVDEDPLHLAWLCARLSDRAMRAVVSGQATPKDALRHSATGTVELVAVDHGRAVPDRCLLCSSIPEKWPLLPALSSPLVPASLQPAGEGRAAMAAESRRAATAINTSWTSPATRKVAGRLKVARTPPASAPTGTAP
jgi:hypothetical protein